VMAWEYHKGDRRCTYFEAEHRFLNCIECGKPVKHGQAHYYNVSALSSPESDKYDHVVAHAKVECSVVIRLED